jgi:hypothetical protein
LLYDSSSWTCIPESDHTIEASNVAFAMLGRSSCGVDQMMTSQHTRYPFKLWQLLENPDIADEISKAKGCQLDPFSTKFRKRFTTRAALRSQACRLQLFMVGSMSRNTICRIECRNASLRRRVKSRIQTHKISLPDLSSSFLLLQQRILEKSSWRSVRGKKDAKERAPRIRKKGKLKGSRTGGGGLRRAALRTLLRSVGQNRSQPMEVRGAKWSEARL